MQNELRQARNVAMIVGLGLLLLIVAALLFGQSESSTGNSNDGQSVQIGNDTKITLLPDTSLKTIDEDFWRYTDERLGFAIDIPKTMWYYALSCEKDDGYYNLEEGKAPVRVFQNDDSVTIAPQYVYVLQGEEAYRNEEGNLARRFSSCEKIEITTSQLADRPLGWTIHSQAVADEDGLRLFLRQYYGETCDIGELTPLEGQEGVLAVGISGDGLDLSETKCLINQTIHTRYSPDAGRVVSWTAGQEATYWSDSQDVRSTEGYEGPGHNDERMTASLEIIPSSS